MSCYFRMCEVGGMDSAAVLKQATQACPRRAEFYYFAARLELSKTTSGGVASGRGCNCSEGCAGGHAEGAVKWLVRCIRSFYTQSSEEKLSTKKVLILYRQVVVVLFTCSVTFNHFRKLLNQMIGYDQTIPPFAEGVDPKNLGDQLAPLWMCYW